VLEEVLRPLTVARFMELRAGGAQILDTRSTADFAKRHLEQSIFVGLGGDYASWAGSILDPEVEIALIAEPGREREAALRLGRIGFDNIAGYVEGGFGAIAASGDCDALLDSWERWDGGRIASELSSPESVFLLDVRGIREREQGHIDGSAHLPLPELARRAAGSALADAFPHDRPIVAYCAGAYRSVIATSLLRRAGYDNCTDLIGGFAAWKEFDAS
jgi:rhodanese-related sulfurtransferase